MNESLLVFLVVFVTLVCSVCTGLLTPLRQRFSKVDPRYFRRVKVRFPSFMFAGIGDKSSTGNVKTYGVITPMFVLHIIGYILTIALWIAVPVLYQYGVDLTELWAAPLAAALLQTVLVVVTEAVCLNISRKRASEGDPEQSDAA